ncbi:MAG: hypothetical protein E7B61_15515, partial [Clostridiales bacterium]|nr:hypothetical protein [Clostridiales bacterium]
LYLLTSVILFSCPTLCGLFSFIVPTKIGISYYMKKRVIIPGLAEPPVRTLRATIPGNESQLNF